MATRKLMERARLDGVELAYELHGEGEPAVLIHWGVSAMWAEPLLDEPALAGYCLLHYDRAGFGGSSPVDGPISMSDHARHCLLLMTHVGIKRAHIVGHSSSAVLALQLALDAPEAVQTLALMEPARPTPPTETQAAFVRECVEPAIGRYRAGDRRAAIDTFFRGVFGPDYRVSLDEGLPGAFDEAVAGADAFFRSGATGAATVVVHGRGCEAHRGAGSRRPRPEHGADVSRATRAVARLATDRRAVRARRCDASAARSATSRHGRSPGILLLQAPASPSG